MDTGIEEIYMSAFYKLFGILMPDLVCISKSFCFKNSLNITYTI